MLLCTDKGGFHAQGVISTPCRQLLTAYTAARGEQTVCQLKLSVFTKWLSEITSSLKNSCDGMLLKFTRLWRQTSEYFLGSVVYALPLPHPALSRVFRLICTMLDKHHLCIFMVKTNVTWVLVAHRRENPKEKAIFVLVDVVCAGYTNLACYKANMLSLVLPLELPRFPLAVPCLSSYNNPGDVSTTSHLLDIHEKPWTL